MGKFYIEANGQKICLETYKRTDVFYGAIRKIFSGSIVRKTSSIDGILTLALREDRGDILKDRRKNYFREKRLLKGKALFWKHGKKDNLGAIYFVRLSKLLLKKVGLVSLITVHAINDFSSECSKFSRSLSFHASSLEKNRKAYLFIGKGGSGKTTVCRLSKKARVLHDDSSVVRKNHRGYYLFPGFDIERKVLPGPGRLKAIFFIKKASVNKLQRLSLKESFKESLKHCRTLGRSDDMIQCYNDLLDLFKKVPSYRLNFRKDPSFWRLIDNL